MKYLFINSVAGFGSTGRIAAEQCRGLMAQGHECVLAFGREEANCSDIPTVRIGTPLDFRLHGAKSRLLDDSGFGSRRATRRFLDWVREYDPDVIWLHNVHGYYIHLGELFPYLRGCGKTIFWTLHDCWSFTGHCAYFDYVGCDRWKTGCHDCPQKRAYPASILLDNSRKYGAGHAIVSAEVTAKDVCISVTDNGPGVELPLKNREYELLLFLIRHPGQVFSREDLYEMIWGLESMGDNITVAVHIGRIRETLEDAPASPKLLQTVWGVGYRLRTDAV